MSFLVGLLRAVLTEYGLKQPQIDGQSCRNELLKKRANAPKVLSNMYEKGTQARNLQADVRHSGRSMVEMLGVLAIIGVLSVGAIAGYQKAMFKYKMNQSLRDFNLIASNLMTVMASQTQLDAFDDTLAVQIGIVPETMVNPETKYIEDRLGNWLRFYFGGYSDTGIKRIGIFFYVYSEEACIQYTLARKEMTNIDYLSFTKKSGNKAWKSLCGDMCSKNLPSLSQLTLAEIQEICQVTCSEGTPCRMQTWFAGDWQTPL